jgi:predicted N-acyltransferase
MTVAISTALGGRCGQPGCGASCGFCPIFTGGRLSATEVEVIETLEGIAEQEWDALTDGNPFTRHRFLHTLHTSGCASRRTGWAPRYLVIRSGGKLAAAMILYAKNHSRGEYVFDYAWAHAYEQNGVPYYPKLVSAVPFTAVTGSRLLARNAEHRKLLARAAIQLALQAEASSVHVLFPSREDAQALQAEGFMMREGVQFHWLNAGYTSFEQFLESMTREKRKKIRQDRKHVLAAGVTYRWLRGEDIGAAELDFFYECYKSTYHSHHSAPYLTAGFFRDIRKTMADSLFLVIAEQHGEPVAAALNFVGPDGMYGRYWGTTQFISGLHFETCYMQAIEYCIEQAIPAFEGGAQGEHKLARGLLPTPTWSAHWIADQRFASAIEEFLERETEQMNDYIDELDQHAPFRKPADTQ